MKILENEKLKVFDEHQNQIGIASREEVHLLGHWHEAFHCWFVSREEDECYIYLQIRSEMKKDYPNLIDITAAGHLLAHESIEDGIREIKEEIGIEVSFNELIPAGVFKYSVVKGKFIDNELAHIFLYETNHTLLDFTLQMEEVSGIVKVRFSEFYELWVGKKEEVNILGFEINNEGQRTSINRLVGRNDFVPHESTYYEHIFTSIKKIIEE
ncbi:NUDIX domain-containing protein [Cytobacillus sp.]|uniref:NUDIX hydrolase n=1 Tax=Cytobacillus sp. TaxID=2675269 RepID=UPI0028BDB00E|nr:NUDIX domain-containing protein [Cytobacillus sp.]